MAAPDVLPADAVAPRLDYLLRRARVVKQSASIDPPLQVSELVPESEPLLGDIEGGKEVRTLAVESAAKSVFYANLVSHHAVVSIPQFAHKSRVQLALRSRPS
jgi:THO complex subunit 1